MNDTGMIVNCPKCKMPLRISLQYKYMKCGRCGSVIDTAQMAAAYRPAAAGQTNTVPPGPAVNRASAGTRSAVSGRTKKKAKHSPVAGIVIAVCFLALFFVGGIILVSRLLLAEPAEEILADTAPEEMAELAEAEEQILQPGSYGLLTPDRLREISAALAEEDTAVSETDAGEGLWTDDAGGMADVIMPEPVQTAGGSAAAEKNNAGGDKNSKEQTKNTGEQTKAAQEQSQSNNSKDLVDHTIYDNAPSGQNGSGESHYESTNKESSSDKNAGSSKTEVKESQSSQKSGSDQGREENPEDTGSQGSGDEGTSSEPEEPEEGDSGGDYTDQSSSSSIRPDVKAVIDNYVQAQREYSEQYDSAPVSKKQKLYSAVIDTFKKFQRLGNDSSLTDEERQYYSEAEAMVDQMYN
ncbi:MAG: hypothetical protein IKO80_00090 [Lachnospiraceae bacterium]|nr:hypothetical protein [Lachnospiraceae bacterium]